METYVHLGAQTFRAVFARTLALKHTSYQFYSSEHQHFWASGCSLAQGISRHWPGTTLGFAKGQEKGPAHWSPLPCGSQLWVQPQPGAPRHPLPPKAPHP